MDLDLNLDDNMIDDVDDAGNKSNSNSNNMIPSLSNKLSDSSSSGVWVKNVTDEELLQRVWDLELTCIVKPILEDHGAVEKFVSETAKENIWEVFLMSDLEL